ncbi:MAG: hypothetical protein ACYDH5_16265 [Acidimicrobiales bacterium]
MVAVECRSTSIYLRDASGAIDRVANGSVANAHSSSALRCAASQLVEGHTVEMVEAPRRIEMRLKDGNCC